MGVCGMGEWKLEWVNGSFGMEPWGMRNGRMEVSEQKHGVCRMGEWKFQNGNMGVCRSFGMEMVYICRIETWGMEVLNWKHGYVEWGNGSF